MASNIVNGLADDKSPRKNTHSICKFKTKIIDIIRKNQIVILYGENGSGKTTQIPQYILESSMDDCAHICVTQPWTIGAILASTKVAKEMGCTVGKEVGYEVEGDNQSCKLTKITYMTEGVLLSHCLKDNILNKYDVIMIDDAHVRSVTTYLLLGLLKKMVIERKTLKLVVTSVVTVKERLSSYFNGAPIHSLESRPHKVSIIYEPIKDNDYVKRSIMIINKLHRGSVPGDILVFLAGQDEVESCCSRLDQIENMTVLTLQGSMNLDCQQDFFMAPQSGQRRVIIATDIVECTVYIDSVKFVIDCGVIKEARFDVKEEMMVLQRMNISKEQAERRRLNCGRKIKGLCYRLYKKEDYEGFLEESTPKIKFKNLLEIYLKIVGLGLDPVNFGFLDPPEKEMLEYCRKRLEGLGVLDLSNKLTDLGRILAGFPTDPVIGTVLLWAHHLNCLYDVSIITSMMSADNVFKNCKEKTEDAHRIFYDEDGDHFTKLNVFKEFFRNEKSKEWCDSNVLNYDVLMQVDQARNELMKIVAVSKKAQKIEPSENRDNIKFAIMKGFLGNKCVRKSPGTYIRDTNKEVVYLHPSSCLFKESHDMILYNELFVTSRAYIRGILKIDEALLSNFTTEMMRMENSIPNLTNDFLNSKSGDKKVAVAELKSVIPNLYSLSYFKDYDYDANPYGFDFYDDIDSLNLDDDCIYENDYDPLNLDYDCIYENDYDPLNLDDDCGYENDW